MYGESPVLQTRSKNLNVCAGIFFPAISGVLCVVDVGAIFEKLVKERGGLSEVDSIDL